MAKYFKIANACVEFPDAYNLPIPPSFAEIDYSTYVELTQSSIPRLEPPKPPVPQMTTQEAILDKLTEIEYRQDLMELGLTEGGTGA